ncbi:MAG: D-alanine--D-alanine ligase [Phycisphaerales bacterium]
MKTVLVLGGGPDAEREVSLKSAAGVAEALRQSGRFKVEARTIEAVTLADLRGMPGDVVFPVLHGSFGEGGPLQDMLERDGRPYVGCRPKAARLAMDKIATKIAGLAVGIPTAEACILNSKDQQSPVGVPAVVKPVHDGSSVGLHICKDEAAWTRARAAVADDVKRSPGRAYMVERYIPGKEITCGLLDGKALPLIHIAPAHGVYDFEAKYTRDDTRYILDPQLSGTLTAKIKGYAETLFAALGARHVSRADFIVDAESRPWLLEINTMPGFTSHSLVPKAAAHAGVSMPELCARLAEMGMAR